VAGNGYVDLLTELLEGEEGFLALAPGWCKKEKVIQEFNRWNIKLVLEYPLQGIGEALEDSA